jgi:capsid protein
MGQLTLLDHRGEPLRKDVQSLARKAQETIFRLRKEIAARYDLADNRGSAFVQHWSNADNLSPDAANQYGIRRKLRSRSRFEAGENNPYLKGTLLQVCNDFTGTGPKWQIIDTRIPKKDRKEIEAIRADWATLTSARENLWRMRMSKIVDGESIKVSYPDLKLDCPIKINFSVLEADQMTTEGAPLPRNVLQNNIIDGVKFDRHKKPIAYYLLEEHPGDMIAISSFSGKWVPAQFVSHWFRKDRGWSRGIPELTTSIPLCALLRRYTLATVKAAETAADFAAVLETQAPPNTNPFQLDAEGNPVEDSPFDTFPIEQGMFTTLPYGYKLSQLRAEHPGIMYNVFVNALLREITRPLNVPFNVAAGSSQESNMAASVVDIHMYKESIKAERTHAEESVLAKDTALFWFELTRSVPRYAKYIGIRPLAIWRWDRVGLDHTDPEKVANAMVTLRKDGLITDRDIQETYYNRNLEDWQDDIREDKKFRDEVELPFGEPKGSEPSGAPAPGKKPPTKKKKSEPEED